MRGSALNPVLFGTSSGTLAVAGRALGNGLVREVLQGLSGLFLFPGFTVHIPFPHESPVDAYYRFRRLLPARHPAPDGD